MNQRERELVEHAIGLDYKNPRNYRERRYYKPYRNGYDAGGIHDVWEGLVKRGLAITENHVYYYVSNKGLAELSADIGVHVYSDCSRCVGDAKWPVLKYIMDSCSGFMSYPVSSKIIAKETRIPVKLVRETCSYLIEEGLIRKTHFGGLTEEGVYCIHGYGLTKEGMEHPYYKESCKRHDEDVVKILNGGKA